MSVLKFSAAYRDGTWIEPCYVELSPEGRLLSLGQSDPNAGEVEERRGYLVPGMSNGHSHSFQYAMAGMSEFINPLHMVDNFWSWRDSMYKLANQIDPDQLLELSTQFYMALLEEGFTGVCEFHYLHHDQGGKAYAEPYRMSSVLLEAANRAGINFTLCPVYYQQAAPGVALKPEQKRFASEDVDTYLHLLEQIATYGRSHHPDMIIGYGVHSMRSASLLDIKMILSAHWTPGPAHVHVSEQSEDARVFESTYGTRAIDWLFDNAALDVHHHLIHATHINSVEVRKLAASGATVVLCPSTEANLGDGIFPLPDFHRLNGSWCIGTDSHVNISPFAEMRALELTHRLLLEKRNILCSEEDGLDSGQLIFDRVAAAGRRALGQKAEPFAVGELFEGVVLDADHDRLLERPLSSVLGVLVFVGDRTLLKEVYAKGKRRVVNGEHEDRARYRGPYRQAMKSLMKA